MTAEFVEKLDAWDFRDTHPEYIYEEYGHGMVVDLSPDNFRRLLKSHNELIEFVNELVERVAFLEGKPYNRRKGV